MTDDKVVSITERSVETRLKNFDALLKTIENLDAQKKQLWLEIYENAIADRQNAFIMFKKTVDMADTSTNMAVHGRTIEKFLEKMSRSNDQLIKLAELVAKAEEEEDNGPSANDMYDRIGQ